ncbi:unnamed protein product [Polarella glacialis]|uniref:Uncharacterized protein n=1 Tax=Polarella glacialis TaxID=89957 RepID=A0A813GYM4_POLGL|nr:unnamed protein product [Polarella glacialis]
MQRHMVNRRALTRDQKKGKASTFAKLVDATLQQPHIAHKLDDAEQSGDEDTYRCILHNIASEASRQEYPSTPGAMDFPVPSDTKEARTMILAARRHSYQLQQQQQQHPVWRSDLGSRVPLHPTAGLSQAPAGSDLPRHHNNNPGQQQQQTNKRPMEQHLEPFKQQQHQQQQKRRSQQQLELFERQQQPQQRRSQQLEQLEKFEQTQQQLYYNNNLANNNLANNSQILNNNWSRWASFSHTGRRKFWYSRRRSYWTSLAEGTDVTDNNDWSRTFGVQPRTATWRKSGERRDL